MHLTPMQLFSQEKILLAIYPGLSIEEAKEKELQFGCVVSISHKSEKYNYNGGNPDFDTVYDKSEVIYIDDEYCWNGRNGIEDYASRHKNPFCTVCVDGDECNITEIIGLPPTLPRVLGIFKKKLMPYVFDIFYSEIQKKQQAGTIPRKLLNEDKTDATLRDQSEETQLAIAKLLGREE